MSSPLLLSEYSVSVFLLNVAACCVASSSLQEDGCTLLHCEGQSQVSIVFLLGCKVDLLFPDTEFNT